jgi:hypothetical protein
VSRDVLDTIDGALDDYISGDAMRWSPEPEKVTPPVRRILVDWERLGPVIEAMLAEFERVVANAGHTLAQFQRLIALGLIPHHRSHAAERTVSPQRRAGSRRTKRYARTAT